MRVCRRAVLILVVVLAATRGWAQDVDKPREFPEFRGTWTLDETATEGLRRTVNRAGQPMVFDPLGFPVARTLVIATTPTEISITKDSDLPEVYRFDGTETQTRDPRTGVPLLPRYSFTLVAGALALTTKKVEPERTEVVTDAYSLAEWNVLRVERQLSYVAPQGYLRTLGGVRNVTQLIVYRRSREAAER
jgi:hypothetical protein